MTAPAQQMREGLSGQPDRYLVCALYRFVTLDQYQAMREPLLARMIALNVTGTVLLAREGINGTVAGSRAGIDRLLQWLSQYQGLETLITKESYASTPPFKRAKVKLKKEIVTLGVKAIDPQRSAGTYVEPAKWNALIDDPDVLVIDTRNVYEIAIGTFENAVNPQTTNFREFPAFVERHLDPERHRKIAMFCTGGIRCEKSTAHLKQQGFEAVYHLKGGILAYLKEVPVAESKWRGECFVFDDRVAVDHHLNEGSYDQCHACRTPVSVQDKQSPHYQQGISCPHCYDRYSDHDRDRFLERERQVHLAKQRGRVHLGPESLTMPKRPRCPKKTD